MAVTPTKYIVWADELFHTIGTLKKVVLEVMVSIVICNMLNVKLMDAVHAEILYSSNLTIGWMIRSPTYDMFDSS